MGKSKRLKALSNKGVKTSKASKAINFKRNNKLTRQAGVAKSQPLTKKHKQLHQNIPIVPFSPNEKILLIGEGDLSFARSLVTHHGCEDVNATVYESAEELMDKYPHVRENIAIIEAGGGVVRYGVDATKMKAWTEGKNGPGVMDRVVFNFPHVGGKTKDVNRQVRYNQELLVSFFKNTLPSLSPRHGSSIIVTLFEGEPYTLWNIRDLARHTGLEVAQSFKFQAAAYPDYRHARTLGVVKNRDGEISGGWRGEERSSRSYVFVRKGEGVVVGEGKKKVESSDDESENGTSAQLDDISDNGNDEIEENGEESEDEG